MKENKNVQSVFRFVTVRSPQKSTPANTLYALVVRPGAATAFHTSLTAAQTSDDLEQRFATMEALTMAFAAGDRALKSEEALKVAASAELLDFAEWLSVNPEGLSATASDKLAGTSMQLSADSKSILWDNLICCAVTGQTNSVAESISLILKADNFIENYQDARVTNGPKSEDEMLKVLARTEVILPKDLFPLPNVLTVKEEEIVEEILPPKANIVALNAEIDLYKNAISELESLHRRQREIVKNTYVVDNTGEGQDPNDPNASPLTSSASIGRIDDFAELNPETQAALTMINATTDLSISFMVNDLQQKVETANRNLFKDAELNQKVLNLAGALWVPNDGGGLEIPRAEPPKDGIPFDLCTDDYDGFYYNDGKCRIKPLGIADFRRVEQELCCYKPGELAHIENILQGEYKERATRRLRRTEDTYTTSTEREEERERDTTTTDRYEMQKETSKVVQKDMAFDLGVSAAGKYGLVSVQVDSHFSTATSSLESDARAVSYGKEVTERALERILTRVKEERSSTVIEEFEENNSHGLDNRGGDKHVVGLYRWVDKIYTAKVVNYGKRLMFEFMITEPGAFHLWAMSKPDVQTNVVLENPIDPRSQAIQAILGRVFKSHKDIDRVNYALFAAQYGANVEAPPADYVATEQNYYETGLADGKDDPGFSRGYNNLKIPANYNPIHAKVLISMRSFTLTDSTNNPDGIKHWLTVSVGSDSVFVDHGKKNGLKTLNIYLKNEIDTLPVSICGITGFYSININVECKLRDDIFEAWQIKTYQAIIDAYENKKAAYEQSLAQAKVQRGVDIQGTNPLMNRSIEQQELKKQCVNWLNYGKNFSSWAVWHWGHDGSPHWMTNHQAVKWGEKAKFLEQGFEWNLMSYKFMPYFYGAPPRWKKLYQLDDADPKFLAFLQAGMARVLVPVRPGMEKQIMHFLRTGQVWQGSEVPAIDSPLYLSIVDELKAPLGTVEGEPWEVRVPTSLTVLQCESGCVEGTGLPCDCAEDPSDAFGTEGVPGSLTGKTEPV